MHLPGTPIRFEQRVTSFRPDKAVKVFKLSALPTDRDSVSLPPKDLSIKPRETTLAIKHDAYYIP